MPKEDIEFSTEKPTGYPLYGAFKGVSISAELSESKKDRSGKSYHKIFVDFQYDPGVALEEGKDMPTKRLFVMLPYDYWKDGENGEPKSLFRQLCDATGKKLEDFKGDPSKTFVGLDVALLLGAQRNWKDKSLKTFGGKNDDEMISYGIVGFAPYKSKKSPWTDEMEEIEKQAIIEHTIGASAQADVRRS
jgi:hypothetical protein